jgi:phosphoglycolate phosphatase-like HAD superfamily hydrolase
MSVSPQGLILWDIDGTLISVASARRDKHHAAAILTFGGPDSAPPSWPGRTDAEILLGLASAVDESPTPVSISTAIGHLEDLTASELAQFPALPTPGAREVLADAHKLGWKSALLTGNSPTRARLKLSSAGFDSEFDWESSYFGHCHVSRQSLVREAIETCRKESPKIPIVIVGDTVIDILAARSAGQPVIAVATGIFSLEELMMSEPSLAVADLAIGRFAFLDFLVQLTENH